MCNNFINGLCKNGSKCPLSHSLESSMALFKCIVCTKIFSSKWGLTCHTKICGRDASEREKFSCHLCTSTFGTKSDRTKHVKRHGGKRFKCGIEDCSAAFKSATEKKTHEKRIHHATTTAPIIELPHVEKRRHCFGDIITAQIPIATHDREVVAALVFLSSSLSARLD